MPLTGLPDVLNPVGLKVVPVPVGKIADMGH